MKDYFSLPNRLTYCALVIIPRILRLLVVKLTHCIKSDELYVKIIYFLTFGKWLDLKHPENLKNFNEKLQWLKLHSETPLHTQMVDKYEMRNIVRKELGEGYTFPLLGVWDRFDEIDFGKLPEQFVLKPTHDSGSIVFCRDRKAFDPVAAGKKLTNALKRNYYWIGRETPYKNVRPRLIAEPLMADNNEKNDLKDYKLYCFNGEVKMLQVDYDRFTNHHRNLYTPDWKFINAFIMYPNDPKHVIPAPKALPQMLEIAGRLSAGLPFVRIDLYLIDEKIYVGEFTFFHEGGLGRIRPRAFNDVMGDWIKLPIES